MLGKGATTNGRGENKNGNKNEEDRSGKDIADQENRPSKIDGRDLGSANKNKKRETDSNGKCEIEYLIEIDPRSHLEVADYPKHR